MMEIRPGWPWILLVLAVGLGSPRMVAAQSFGGNSNFELEDVIAVEVLDRDVLAFHAQGGGGSTLRLELDERLVFAGAQGRVAVVLTDRRALAVSPESSSWREVRYRVHETRPEDVLLGDRVAMVFTNQRAIGFNGRSGSWFDLDIGPRETIRAGEVGPSVALVVTDHEAFGLSRSSGFVGTDLRLRETVERVNNQAAVATITTSQRVLVFREPAGTWSSFRRPVD